MGFRIYPSVYLVPPTSRKGHQVLTLKLDVCSCNGQVSRKGPCLARPCTISATIPNNTLFGRKAPQLERFGNRTAADYSGIPKAALKGDLSPPPNIKAFP